MDLETLLIVIMLIAAVCTTAGLVIHVRSTIQVVKLESRLKKLREELDEEYAEGGGLVGEQISAEGKTIRVWHLVKSEKMILLENEIRIVLDGIYRADPARGGKLAMSLISKRGL